MIVLITGAQGQLGSDLVQCLKSEYEIVGLNRTEMDVTNMAEVNRTIHQVRPEVIIHCAAYTKVDLAEQDPDGAYLVNTYGTRNVAVAAQKVGAKVVFISTDYVFDGNASVPYRESSPENPCNIYGKSKLFGEEMVKTLSDKYFIVRTSWLYGIYGENFVKTMLKLGQERDEVSVVDDQIGSPTYTIDLANFIKELIPTDLYGIYHASNSGSCTWFEFAKAIFQETGLEITLNPVETKDFHRPAPRPSYSVLDHMSIRLNGFKDFRHWRMALQDYLTNRKL